MEGVNGAHQIFNVEGRRDGSMGLREGILERPELVSLLMGRTAFRHSGGRGISWW